MVLQTFEQIDERPGRVELEEVRSLVFSGQFTLVRITGNGVWASHAWKDDVGNVWTRAGALVVGRSLDSSTQRWRWHWSVGDHFTPSKHDSMFAALQDAQEWLRAVTAA